LHLDPNDVLVNEGPIVILLITEVTSYRLCNQRLNLTGRDAADGAGLFRDALQKSRGDVVPVLDARLRAWLGVMRWPRSSKIRPANSASDLSLEALWLLTCALSLT
jgi:hypothetical protein